MLIINADDFGKSVETTDNIVACFRRRCITSTSAMVFMQDSERAANVALEHRLEVGLHLNFDEEFSGTVPNGKLREYLRRAAAFLTKSRFHQAIYNPLLKREFEYLYRAQYEEFARLYGEAPPHINGHHHRHLCSNVLLGKVIPIGERVRRSFTFLNGERQLVTMLYRRVVDMIVERRYVSTDMFYAATPAESFEVLRMHALLAIGQDVELMVHASTDTDMRFLMRDQFLEALSGIECGTYRDLDSGETKVGG